MKTKLNLLVLIAGFFFSTKAQVVFYEGFTAPFNAAGSGWNIQNLSAPVGSTSWFQGNNMFPALDGNSNDYFACNFNSTGPVGATNTISTWLITPTLNLVNGGRIEFATRAPNVPGLADRMQVYYSDAGTGTNVGTTAGTATNTAGTFTNIMLDINAGLNPAPGYPKRWTVYTTTISGLAAPTVGRIAFRYYVPNGGSSGANSNFVGIDEFRYSLPCAFPSISFSQVLLTACSGQSVLCQGGLGSTSPITSYTWNTTSNATTPSFTIPHTQFPGQNVGVISSSAAVSPTITSTYYYLAETTPGCVRMAVSLPIVVNPNPTVTIVQTPTSICSSSNFTVSASGAANYTFMLGNVSTTANPAIIQAPPLNTLTTLQYTATGRDANGCSHTQTVQMQLNPNPTVNAVVSNSTACLRTNVTVTASGAATYTWSGAASSAANPITYNTGSSAGVKHFTVYGVSLAGCKSANALTSMTVATCTGIDDYSVANTPLSVYPNPFSNELMIKEFGGTLKIYNELGQLVYQFESTNLKFIDTSHFKAGIYILHAFSTSGEQTHLRLIKN